MLYAEPAELKILFSTFIKQMQALCYLTINSSSRYIVLMSATAHCAVADISTILDNSAAVV